MNKKQIHIIALVAGVVLLFLGYNESSGTGAKVLRAVSGSYSNKVLFFYIAGAISTGFGAFGLLKK